jgi:hypothetical protein
MPPPSIKDSLAFRSIYEWSRQNHREGATALIDAKSKSHLRTSHPVALLTVLRTR